MMEMMVVMILAGERYWMCDEIYLKENMRIRNEIVHLQSSVLLRIITAKKV